MIIITNFVVYVYSQRLALVTSMTYLATTLWLAHMKQDKNGVLLVSDVFACLDGGSGFSEIGCP